LGPVPPGAVVAIAAVLTFVPPFLVIEFFLDLWLAILGTVCFSAAILLLGRWPGRPQNTANPPSNPAAATPASAPSASSNPSPAGAASWPASQGRNALTSAEPTT